ncbi:hypothetical protein BEV13_04080 [Rickettsiella grylli]|nr:hypothetical protein BEV13_04080 [Rickettsiella grylli]
MQMMLTIFFSVFCIFLGSFFTVVVYRLPLILNDQWKKNALNLLNQENLVLTHEKKFNLFLPFSHCPHCKKYLTILQKIPLLSYFILGRKCSHCQIKISFRYPLIELLTLVVSLSVIGRFGLSLQTISALILTWGLLILAFIDFEHQLLPDIIIFPLMWCGLLLSIKKVFVSPESAILGASGAYLFLYLLAKGYQWIIKTEPMGEGDFKCFALLGSWFGIKTIPYILFIAAATGSLVGIVYYLYDRESLKEGIPFGPFLALSGWVTLLSQLYL